MTAGKRKVLGAAAAAGAFAVFLLVALHRLDHASLWLDESIEFWYSRILSGPLPFESSANMLERINSTFQPPLYNFLMYFWLQISTSQWWFRFFGVVAGFAGTAGLFLTARRLTGSDFAAAGAVLFSSFVFQLVYYWQEAAEYCLLLAFMFWALYWWVCLLQSPSKKNIIALAVFCVLAVYSQYGAAFPVALILLSALIAVLRQKKKELTRTLLISWGAAFVFAALPLFRFFLLPQLAGQHEDGLASGGITFYRSNILVDFAGGAAAVFQWCMTLFLPAWATAAVLGLFVLLAAVMFFRGSRFLKVLIGFNLALWIVYYIALKLNLYAYGHFRGRYALFFIPCWLVLGTAMIAEARNRLRERKNGKALSRGFLAVTCVLCAALCVFSWQLRLRDNWEKEDNRTAAAVWARENPEGRDTVVYYGAAAGFSYYLYNDPACASVPRDRIVYMPWRLRKLTAEEYASWYDGVFGSSWPKEVYFVSQHLSGDLETMLAPFLDRGYRRENLNGVNDIHLTLPD